MDNGRDRSKVVLWVAVLGVIIVAALGATAYHVLRTTQKDARKVGLPIPVQTLPAKVQSIDEMIGASGSTQPSMTVNATAHVVARVLQVPVDVGSIVRPKDLLVEFDPKLYLANLAYARANYDHEHQQLLRTEKLARKGFAAPTDVENARVLDAQTYDAVVSAEIDLTNTKVLSTVSGVVLSRSVNPGETSQMDETLLQIGVLDPVDMDAAVPEDKMGYVYLGMPGEVGTDAFPGRVFKGTVAKTDGIVDPTTRTFGAYIRLSNRDLSLKKGVTGYARLISHRIALAVASTAIMNPVGDRATVFVVDTANRAHLRQVRTGLSNGGLTEILSGLKEGEQVVVMGQFDLQDNDRVLVNQSAPWNKS